MESLPGRTKTGMKLRESIAYLRDNNPKEFKALHEAIDSTYLATDIMDALKSTLKAEGQDPRFEIRVVQRMVKDIRENRKTLEDFTA